MKAKLIFIGKKQQQKKSFEKPKTQIPNPKNCHFPAPPISNLPFGNSILRMETTTINFRRFVVSENIRKTI